MFKVELAAAHAHLEAAKEVGSEMFTELRKRDRDLVERAANARLGREEKRKRGIQSGSDLRSQYRNLALDYAVQKLRAGGLPTFTDARNYVASKTGRSPDTVKKYLAGILDEAQRKFVARSK